MARFIPALSHAHGWLVHRFVGELESPPVTGADHQPSAVLRPLDLRNRINAVFRVHVHGTHEPTRLVCSNWQNRQIKRAEPLSDSGELGMQCRVAGKEDPMVATLESPPAPQGAIAAAKRTPRKMLRRHAGHIETEP